MSIEEEVFDVEDAIEGQPFDPDGLVDDVTFSELEELQRIRLRKTVERRERLVEAA